MEILQNGPVQANLRVYEDFLYYKTCETMMDWCVLYCFQQLNGSSYLKIVGT